MLGLKLRRKAGAVLDSMLTILLRELVNALIYLGHFLDLRRIVKLGILNYIVHLSMIKMS